MADAAGGHAASQLPHPIQRSSIIFRDEGIASVGQTGIQRLHFTHASVSINAFLTWWSPGIPTLTVIKGGAFSEHQYFSFAEKASSIPSLQPLTTSGFAETSKPLHPAKV